MEGSKRNIIVALMVATFLTAIDTTVVSTAMATIVRDLGGSELISWVFSIYLLTAAVTTPIYGKLADLFGRKRVFLFGTTLFLVGSVLCGLSGSMMQLMIFRSLQGLGAGAVQPITLTIIGDIFTQEERARLMGLFGAMWGVAGIVGPLVGGFFVDYVSWHWIFFINVPVGLISILLIVRSFRERMVPKAVQIDYLGAVLFTLSIGLFLYTLLAGGEHDWRLTDALLLAASAVLFAVFLAVEKRAPVPMLPLALFKRRLIAVSEAVSFMQGAVLIGSSAYLPLWIQQIQGHSATYSGFALLPMSIGWPLASSLGGRLLLKAGYKRVAVIGMAVLAASTTWLALLTPESPAWTIPVLLFFFGAGFGFSVTSLTIAVQSSVTWQQRGVATGSLQFVRTVGQTVGVAILGAWLNMYLHRYGAAGTAAGLSGVFLLMLLTALAGLVLALLLPAQAEQAKEEQ